MSVESPKDADGREIPLDTKRLYDSNGVPVSIRAFRYNPNECFWRVERLDGLGTPKTTELRLTPPDSWKKLEEDLDRGADALNYEACAYFGKIACDCSSCIADKGGTCERVAMRDILTRIRKLSGED